jgi:hypothetical protein
MAAAKIENPYRVAMDTLDITKTFAQIKIVLIHFCSFLVFITDPSRNISDSSSVASSLRTSSFSHTRSYLSRALL